MDKRNKELLEKSGEILYRANVIRALFKTIKNSIQYSEENDENLAYILIPCDILQKHIKELVNKADIFEREFI